MAIAFVDHDDTMIPILPVLHKTLPALVLATTLSSNVLFTQLPSTAASIVVETSAVADQTALTSSPTFTSSSSLLSSSSSTAAIMPLPFRRYDTAGDIPTSLYKKNKVIRGRVVKVIDGDTIRIRHTPLYPISKKGEYCGKLSECTISVRLYGVDAPETAKFGNPEQPYAREAKEYVAKQVDGKIVRVKLLRKDQYSRAVGKVTKRNNILPFLRTDLTKGLAEKGYATLYTGGGAEYDGKRDVLEKKIQRAQRRKRGIWSNGVGNHVDPAAYKREIKAKKKGNKGGTGNGRGSGKENIARGGASVPVSVY